MNISAKRSKYIKKIENKLKMNIVDSKYLVIKRESKNAPLGLFGHYITNLGWIEYALRKNMIPVIDMQNYQNSFHSAEEVGYVNTWEYFFEQPGKVGVDEALRSGKARYIWKEIPDYQPNESLDFLYNEQIVDYFRDISRKYIVIKDDVKKELEIEEKKLFEENSRKRILGVLARGTDYITLRPYFHPVQPTVDKLCNKIDEYRKRFDCEKIYLATEDQKILDTLKRRYSSDLLYTDQKRIYKTNTYLNDTAEFVNRSGKIRGVEYLKSIYLLSRCNGLVAGRTSGTVGAMLMSEGYEFQYVFSLGRYGVEDALINK